MNLTIDPDVFYAAKADDEDCTNQLVDLRENLDLFTITVDNDELILSQYADFISDNIKERSGNGKMIARLLDKLLSSGQILTISPLPFPSDIQNVIINETETTFPPSSPPDSVLPCRN